MLLLCFSPSSLRLLLPQSTQTSGVEALQSVSGRTRPHLLVGTWSTLLLFIALPHLFVHITAAISRDWTVRVFQLMIKVVGIALGLQFV